MKENGETPKSPRPLQSSGGSSSSQQQSGDGVIFQAPDPTSCSTLISFAVQVFHKLRSELPGHF